MAVQLNNSVARAFAILDLFSEKRTELTARDVAAELGLNTVTAHRFLRSLAAVGAIVAVSRGRYRLGYMFVDLGYRVVHSRHLSDIAQPVLDEVSADIQEASMAGVYEAGKIACIAMATARRALSVRVHVGSRLPAYCIANGKVWLAHMPDRELKKYLAATELRAMSDRTLIARDELLRELEKVRRDGYAINDEEREEGLRAIAVPVSDRSGQLLASISVFGPTSRMTSELMERARARLDQAAKEIETRLYGRIAA